MVEGRGQAAPVEEGCRAFAVVGARRSHYWRGLSGRVGEASLACGVGRGLPRVTWVRFWIGNGVLDSLLTYPERNKLSRSRRVIRLSTRAHCKHLMVFGAL